MFLAVSMNDSPLLTLELEATKSWVSALRRLAAKAKLARVRVDAAHERGVQHARQLDVAHVAAAPAEQPRVLLARDGGAERVRRAGGRHGIA